MRARRDTFAHATTGIARNNTRTTAALCSSMAGRCVDSRWLLLAVIFTGISCTELDRTVLEGKRGRAVVHAVLTKLDSCEVNNLTDHRLLRRIAYVETTDRFIPASGGGIWAVKQSHLEVVSHTLREWLGHSCRHLLNNINTLIQRVLLDPYGATNIPMVSGLVASLYLRNLTLSRGEVIPLAGDIPGQAKFWSEYYNNDSTKTFTRIVESLEKKEGELDGLGIGVVDRMSLLVVGKAKLTIILLLSFRL